MSNSGQHAVWHSWQWGPMLTCTTCPPLSLWLSPAELPCPAARSHTHHSPAAKHLCAISAVWAETRARGGRSAVLTQVIANNFVCFYSVAKHNPVNCEKHVVMFSILIKEFENTFQNCWKNKSFFFVCVYLQLHFLLA